MAQVLCFGIFSKKVPHLNVVEYKSLSYSHKLSSKNSSLEWKESILSNGINPGYIFLELNKVLVKVRQETSKMKFDI